MSNSRKLEFTRRKGTPQIVGNFFEQLTPKVLQGIEKCEPEQGDFVRWDDPSLIIEVKASDNNHAFRLPKRQFEEQKGHVGFVFDDHVYVLCKYKNRQPRNGSKKRKSLLHRLRSAEKIHDYLAQGDIRIHILERSVITALERRFYPQGDLPLGLDEEATIEIHHRTLEKFSDPFKSRAWLRELKLSGISIVSFGLRLAPDNGDMVQIPMHITITTVFPRTLCQKMCTVLFPKIGNTQKAAAA